ncbi:hypothetical protein PCASD_05396 [Puccinia coronata f. sp. avenae]|uniref:Uncharacterized protein n=1 Tax=Puccinia coronata f. sp. avenae TaxID=200324 RepID=A0A2N5UV12_9BASI|nr:hypothetical protein PCASD_05396 [Puccinia coronata f. sp. avenae]
MVAIENHSYDPKDPIPNTPEAFGTVDQLVPVDNEQVQMHLQEDYPEIDRRTPLDDWDRSSRKDTPLDDRDRSSREDSPLDDRYREHSPLDDRPRSLDRSSRNDTPLDDQLRSSREDSLLDDQSRSLDRSSGNDTRLDDDRSRSSREEDSLGSVIQGGRLSEYLLYDRSRSSWEENLEASPLDVMNATG